LLRLLHIFRCEAFECVFLALTLCGHAGCGCGCGRARGGVGRVDGDAVPAHRAECFVRAELGVGQVGVDDEGVGEDLAWPSGLSGSARSILHITKSCAGT
jgi:hypothetical protein